VSFVRGIAAVSCSALVGCGILLATDSDSDPPSQVPGAADATASDGLVPTADDGAAQSDAGADASASPACPAGAFFCADFDDGGSPWGFDQAELTTLALPPAGGAPAPSPPNVLRAGVNGGAISALATRAFSASSKTHVIVRYRTRLTTFKTIDELVVGCRLRIGLTGRVEIATNAHVSAPHTVLRVEDAVDGGETLVDFPDSAELGTSFRVVELDLDLGKSRVSVSVDGVAVGSTAAPAAPSITLEVGAQINFTSTGNVFEHDDVSVVLE
jgi:hypothetical protein